MTPKLLKQASDFIGQKEGGFKSSAYKCSAGIWTIGYGDTEWLKQFPDPEKRHITKDLAIELFEKRIQEDYFILTHEYKEALTDNQITALLSLMYNIGRKAFLSSTVLARLKSNDTKENTAEAFLMWCKETKNGEKVFSKSLFNRRTEEKALFLK